MCVGNAYSLMSAVRLVAGGEFRFHKVYNLLQHCIVTVVVAAEVSCHTAVVENMQ